jgi:hypothetical protein
MTGRTATAALVATVPMAVFIAYTASAGSPYKTGGPIVVLGAALLVSVLIGAYLHCQGQRWALASAWFATIAALTVLALAYNGMALLQPTICHPWTVVAACDQFRAGHR